jgi:methylenetetrahydrofolate--tRNA-(uracil-5-)-methyltransferase
LRLLPGLQNVEIVRYGVIHKNIFINSPAVLQSTFQSQVRPDLFFAGQLTGVEGYVESAAAGLMAGLNMARVLNNQAPLTFPRETMLGSLAHYITTTAPKHFQPMNSNWALLPPVDESTLDALATGKKRKISKDDKAKYFAERALAALENFMAREQLHPVP